MAEFPQEGSGEKCGMIDRFTVIVEVVHTLHVGQQSLKSMLQSKPDKFKKEIMSSIDETKINTI